MNVRKLNEIFGYGLFVVGALKLLLAVLVILQFGTNIAAIMNGENIETDTYANLSMTVALAQIILALGSIIMIFVNIKRNPEVITGYLLGLGAIMLEFITPSFLTIFMVFVQCGMYMKAGTKITNKNVSYKSEHKTSKRTIKNTDWFYSERKEQKNKSEQIEIQAQKRKAKLEKELGEWKELLELGEIDEATYNEETNRLIEKERKWNERMKRF